MGDFFSRMAERTLGSRTGIRPDFAPESTVGLRRTGRDTLNETIAALHESEPIAEAGAAPVVEPSALRADDDGPRERTEHTAESTSHQPALPTWAGRRMSPAIRAMHSAREDPHEWPSASKRSDHPVEVHVSADGERSTHETVASVHQKIRPSVSSNRIEDVGYAAEQVSGISREMQQTIHVSIGRVEVRAVTQTAAVPKERPRERHMAARVSLDEYLRQRNERQR